MNEMPGQQAPDFAGGDAGRGKASVQGKNNAAVADSLVLSERAVEKHINSLFSKLGLGEEPTKGHLGLDRQLTLEGPDVGERRQQLAQLIAFDDSLAAVAVGTVSAIVATAAMMFLWAGFAMPDWFGMLRSAMMFVGGLVVIAIVLVVSIAIISGVMGMIGKLRRRS